MRTRPGLDPARISAIVVLATVALLLVACTEKPEDVREPAGGASIEHLQTQDGLTLDARLWASHPERLVIYLHEYREDQTSWWPYARQVRAYRSSALTFDFRGHGDSEGDPDDVEGMLNDVRAAMTYAQEHRYKKVMLVGAGMGGAIAIVAAAEYPDVTVVGFSVPSDFDVFTPLLVAPDIRDRISVVASRDDLSAAYSLRQFRDEAGLDAAHAVEYPGGSHGVDMLSGRAGADVRKHFDNLLTTFWGPAAQVRNTDAR